MATLLDRIKKLEARVAHMLDQAERPGCTNRRHLRVAELIHTAQAREHEGIA